ncbi:MAG: PEP-CTERM sorting domain-containing protein [Verrucomicrobia bacterium]|nr:PEP-CTERM sorting domain-containing protein [Verrucomicrobiota bacterium]
MNAKFTLALCALTLTAVLTGYAASPAADQSSLYAPSYTWGTGTNNGVGFSSWTLTKSGTGGYYIGGSGENVLDSFALYSGSDSGSAFADRSFTNGPLSAGQTFSFDIGGTSVDQNGVIGMNLMSGSTPVFTFKFTGGQLVWALNDGGGGGDFNTDVNYMAGNSSTVPPTAFPVSFAFTYNGGSSYSVLITEGSHTYVGPNYTATNPLNDITGFRFFSVNQGGGQNVGFDNLSVVPEPSSLALLGGASVLGASFYLRRRRKS